MGIDIARARVLAGLPAKAAAPITEAVDQLNEWGRSGAEDDGEDPDVKVAKKDKKQSEFENRNKDELKAAEKAAAKKDEKKKEVPASKKEVPAEKKETPAVEKKEESKKGEAAAEEAKKRGRASGERGGSLRAWHAENKPTRAAFMAHAASLNVGKAHASTMFHGLQTKSKKEAAEPVKESYILRHPVATNHVLCEGHTGAAYTWLPDSDDQAVFALFSLADAKNMIDLRGQNSSTIEEFDLGLPEE